MYLFLNKKDKYFFNFFLIEEKHAIGHLYYWFIIILFFLFFTKQLYKWNSVLPSLFYRKIVILNAIKENNRENKQNCALYLEIKLNQQSAILTPRHTNWFRY